MRLLATVLARVVHSWHSNVVFGFPAELQGMVVLLVLDGVLHAHRCAWIPRRAMTVLSCTWPTDLAAHALHTFVRLPTPPPVVAAVVLHRPDFVLPSSRRSCVWRIDFCTCRDSIANMG